MPRQNELMPLILRWDLVANGCIDLQGDTARATPRRTGRMQVADDFPSHRRWGGFPV